jgi:hypothetical protein
MPRGGPSFIAEAGNTSVEPVLLVRLLNMPMRSDPSTRISLYLTDAQHDVTFFDENGLTETYTACALSFDAVENSTSNAISQCRLRLDNVAVEFSSHARLVEINGATVHVLRAFAETLSSPDGAATVFHGHVENCVIGEPAFEALVQTDFSLNTRVPRRLFWVKDFPLLPSSKDPRTVFVR